MVSSQTGGLQVVPFWEWDQLAFLSACDPVRLTGIFAPCAAVFNFWINLESSYLLKRRNESIVPPLINKKQPKAVIGHTAGLCGFAYRCLLKWKAPFFVTFIFVNWIARASPCQTILVVVRSLTWLILHIRLNSIVRKNQLSTSPFWRKILHISSYCVKVIPSCAISTSFLIPSFWSASFRLWIFRIVLSSELLYVCGHMPLVTSSDWGRHSQIFFSAHLITLYG